MKVLIFAKLLLVTLTVNPTCYRYFLKGDTLNFFFRNTSTGNRLNHCIIVHVHCGKTDQSNMEVAKDFKGFRFPL